MGTQPHPTVEVVEDETKNVPEVNGHALDSLAGVEAALDYLTDDYNDGYITRTVGEDRLVVFSRYRKFEHMDSLLDAHASDDTPVQVVDVGAREFNGEYRTAVTIDEE